MMLVCVEWTSGASDSTLCVLLYCTTGAWQQYTFNPGHVEKNVRRDPGYCADPGHGEMDHINIFRIKKCSLILLSEE